MLISLEAPGYAVGCMSVLPHWSGQIKYSILLATRIINEVQFMQGACCYCHQKKSIKDVRKHRQFFDIILCF